MKVKAAPQAAQGSYGWALIALLFVGLVVRLAFIGSRGFETDVQTFEAWALSLAEHGFAQFYNKGNFADYPPGYFYVLAFAGWIWESLFRAADSGHYVILRVLVKLPAILADLGVGALLYAIVRRYARPALALGAAALYILNPAVIFNSALWGQVDSISAGFALLAVYLLLRGDDDRGPGWWTVGAWLAFGYSLLIKPQAAVLLPLFIAFAFAAPDAERRKRRLFATAIGAVAALVFAVGLSEPFHPSNPLGAFVWLFGRYEFGSSVYPYNSVNAFNLWAIRGQMWQNDTNYVLMFPQYVWGIVLVVAAVGLVVWRYLQEKTAAAFLQGCAIASLAFFVLATRMHERYVFDAVVFTIVCLPFAKRYLWGAIALTVVLYANLKYSLQYLYDVSHHVPGVNSLNLWGPGTTLFALLAVGTFFWLGYVYLGTDPAEAAERESNRLESELASEPVAADAARPEAVLQARAWFDPGEGLRGLSKPWDYVVMFGFGLLNFVLSFINYWSPRTKIFDEIYFARAGEEYLRNVRIYEDTHPPLTKLIITLSMMLFGGMPKGHGLGGWTFLNAIIGHMSNGDNSFGWRFLNVVFGAVVVMLLYAFAKRVTGSTLFAAITALFLTLDGMHFVQSRIATPEGIVIFFSVAAVYAFYRFWISAQVIERRRVDVPAWGFALAIAVSALLGYLLAEAMHFGWKFDTAATAVAAVYCACGFYLLARYVAMPRIFGDGRREYTYPDGSVALVGPAGTVLRAPDGGSIDERGKVVRGAHSQNDGGVLRLRDGDLTVDYARDGSVTYHTPEGEATYRGDAVEIDGKVAERGRSSKLWLILFTVALGLLVSSKWYGVMGFGVSFTVLILVFLQRFLLRKRPALFGNPRSVRLDGALVTILFISASVYTLVWGPDLLRHAPGDIQNFNDVIYRQYSMFEYHDTLKATHPYSSKWWEWPIDYVPIAYYYQDHRKDQTNPNGCCLREITSMPNPMLLWFGLLTVPWVGVLAWRLRNKGYALIVLDYLLQWVPWRWSPRIAFEYHYYVDIPLVCLCNAIVLQRVWAWAKGRDDQSRALAVAAIGGYVLIVLASFVFFYPILAAVPITWNAWHDRMWIPTWIVGPG